MCKVLYPSLLKKKKKFSLPLSFLFWYLCNMPSNQHVVLSQFVRLLSSETSFHQKSFSKYFICIFKSVLRYFKMLGFCQNKKRSLEICEPITFYKINAQILNYNLIYSSFSSQFLPCIKLITRKLMTIYVEHIERFLIPNFLATRSLHIHELLSEFNGNRGWWNFG